MARAGLGEPSADITVLLRRMNRGDAAASEALFEVLQDELHRLSSRHMRRESRAHTLQTTALVHEAYLRLVGSRGTRFKDRMHFLAVASRVMRSILVDHARRRRRAKRGGRVERVPLNDLVVAFEDQGLDIVDLDQALRRLEGVDPTACRVVEMRFFGGMTMAKVAAALSISVSSAERDWEFARAWLKHALS